MSSDLSPTTQALLPATEETVRCADHARAHSIDPVGTAVSADMVVVIDTPLPWPKPVFDHPWLTGVTSTMTFGDRRARVLASVPRDPDHLSVTVFERRGAGTESTILRTQTPHDLDQVITDLGAAPANASYFAHGTTATPRALLVCTQGSHDVCCGTEGMRFAIEAEERFPELGVFRVSHTGGHRFAPTAMLLPEGRMWAHLDIDALDSILNGLEAGSPLIDRCRGWWGAATPRGQAAERAVFDRLGTALDRVDRHVEDFGDGRLLVQTPAASYDVTVSVARTVPTIACRAPGGLPAKTALEYRVDSVRQRGA